MEFKLVSEKKNELFKRKEVEFEVTSEITPKEEEVIKAIAEKYKVDEDVVKTKGIHGNFGSYSYDVTANVYDSFADKENFEIKTKKQRDAEKKARDDELKRIKEEKKKAEEEKKAQEEAAKAEVEKPAEENPEEAKE